jgi:hypothetical protein
MSSGSCSSNKPDHNDDGYGQGGYHRQFANPAYNDTAPSASTQEGMTTQPSVGRFTEHEKASSMFSRKPSTPKNYDGSSALAGQSNRGVRHSGQESQSNPSGIVSLRPAPPRGEGKVRCQKLNPLLHSLLVKRIYISFKLWSLDHTQTVKLLSNSNLV